MTWNVEVKIKMKVERMLQQYGSLPLWIIGLSCRTLDCGFHFILSRTAQASLMTTDIHTQKSMLEICRGTYIEDLVFRKHQKLCGAHLGKINRSCSITYKRAQRSEHVHQNRATRQGKSHQTQDLFRRPSSSLSLFPPLAAVKEVFNTIKLFHRFL